MALNETAKRCYEREVERLLGLDDVKIIKENFLNMRSQIDDLYVELGERARRIAEQESKLEHSNERIRVLESMLGIRSAKENIELANKLYSLNLEVPNKEETLEKLTELGKEGKILEKPLPFSDEQYEEKIDKIEKVVLGIQAYLKKGTEQKIKELEEEQEKLKEKANHYRIWEEIISPLKPKSEVHKVKEMQYMGKFFRFHVKDKDGNIEMQVDKCEMGKFTVHYPRYEISAPKFRAGTCFARMNSYQVAMLIFAYSESEYFRFVEEMEKFYKELDDNE